jgi:nicotinamidase-related amidase
MKHNHSSPQMLALSAALAGVIGLAAPSAAQNIVDEWANVQVPPPPDLKKVTIDPKTTALILMGFVKDSCNVQRRPRCAATIPNVWKLLAGARAHGVMVLHSVPTNNPSGDFIVQELAPLPGELIIPPNGPNKFLPFDLNFKRYPDFDLEKAFKDHGITTLIKVGTQVQTAVLHTAAEAALRGYKVVVPVDGMSGDSLYPEQYTAWHLANTQRVMQQVTLTKIELVGY